MIAAQRGHSFAWAIAACRTFGDLLLDGRHRWRACAELGIDVRVVRFAGTEEEAISRVASLNGAQRSLTPSQATTAALALERLYAAALAKAKAAKRAEAAKDQPRSADGKLGPKPSRTTAISQSYGAAEPKVLTAAELAAKATGANPRYVYEAKRIARERPDLIPQIRDGKLTTPPNAKRPWPSRSGAFRIWWSRYAQGSIALPAASQGVHASAGASTRAAVV